MDIREMRQLAAKHELSLNYIYKDLMISTALGMLQDDRLILKGGTAINRLYIREKARFSEDIDMDFVFAGEVREAITPLKALIAPLKGFAIEKPRIMKSTVRFDAFFKNPLDVKDRIMVEFTIKKSARDYTKEVVNFGFVPCDAALLNVYSLHALFQQKIACLKTRTEGKDIYDAFYLADLWKERLPREEYQVLLEKLHLSHAQITYIANSTNHYIPKSLRPDWPSFIAELKEKLKQKR